MYCNYSLSYKVYIVFYSLRTSYSKKENNVKELITLPLSKYFKNNNFIVAHCIF